MNEKVRSRVQATEMGFLQKISNLTLLDKVKSADIRESLHIELLLLGIERSRLRWYEHVTRIFQERTAKSCSVQHRLVEGLETVPELDGEITLKILAGLVLASHHCTRVSILCCRGLRCFEISTRAAALATPQG